MQSIDCLITKENKIERSVRVKQLEGMFDVPVAEKTRHQWQYKFDLPDQWNIGIIVGPSGSGKSTLLSELFGDKAACNFKWTNRAIIDDFPQTMGIKKIVEILSKVGFSSPPSWLKPFSVLSNGEKFRVQLARLLCETPTGEIAVMDEFTSVIDRTVAKVGSAALSKVVRKLGLKIILASCHYDILEWLCPDWIIDVQKNQLARGLLQRPKIELEIFRTPRSTWQLFRDHHYLSGDLNKAAYCFVGCVENKPAAFTAVLHFPHPEKSSWREHRTVCLPDFQGVGIGNAMADYVAALFASQKSYISTSSHPGIIAYRNKSKLWCMTCKPSLNSNTNKPGKTGMEKSIALTKLTASFKYVGPKRDVKLKQFIPTIK